MANTGQVQRYMRDDSMDFTALVSLKGKYCRAVVIILHYITRGLCDTFIVMYM